ncbi:MAG: guanylate cyclase [Candidatus Eremiobacteraeota bacterium]|nr:guanylate cyclase [Candidatus Eremiobacteraeota bacterium]
MLRTLFSFRGLILVFGLVAVMLPIALVGQLGIVRTLNTINADVAQTRQGALATAAVLQYQLDEETGVRGFAATGRHLFLEPYERALTAMPDRLLELEQIEYSERTNDADDRTLAELRRVNREWLDTVAEPIVAGARDQEARLLHGKRLIDRFRVLAHSLDAHYSDRYAALVARRERTIRTTTLVGVLAIAVIGLEIIVFGAVIARMRRELDRERGFVETLQSAASVRLVAPPHLAIGTAYRSATRGTRIGGDVYDVYRLDADRTLLLVADVSGKGLTAAVDTTFVRYAVRALASEGLAPDEIVTRFDDLYRCANPPPESFVTLFAGVHDRRDGSVEYVNAGHEACWVRRGTAVVVLPPTGPIVGLGGIPFAAARTPLAAGELLVLATDGLTEGRDARGGIVGIVRATEWVAKARARTPQDLADNLVAAVTRYTRGRITDDLAILVVEPLP